MVSTSEPACVIVTGAWAASYADPVRVGAGDVLKLTGRTDSWDGHRWLWAVSEAGQEGWIPDTLVPAGCAGCTVLTRSLRAYDAAELSCRAGVTLRVLEATHGWVRCLDGTGQAGWVPERNLSPVQGSTG